MRPQVPFYEETVLVNMLYLESRQPYHSGSVKAMTGKIAFHKNCTESEEAKIACLQVITVLLY